MRRRVAREVKRFPDVGIEPIEIADLDQRDGAFAHALYDAVIRRWGTLRYLLDRALKRPLIELEAKAQAALLTGAAQILFMDSTPSYAAVHESVDWAKRRIRPGAGGLVNAALRRVCEMIGPDGARRASPTGARDELPLSDGGALALSAALLPDDDVARLAIATSHPEELIRHWAQARTLTETRALALHGLAHPPIILNTAHLTAPLPMQTPATPHEAPGHHVFEGTHDQLLALLGARRDVWVQDPASSLAAQTVAGLDPRVVLDLCAGRGTKTRQLAFMFPDAEIIATDIDERKRVELEAAFAGDDRVQTPSFGEIERFIAHADLALVDAPCSNTGVLARRVEARHRWSPKKTRDLVAIQRQLIADSLRLLRDDRGQRGGILYSTCSLDPAENEAQIAWAEKWHDLRLVRSLRRPLRGGPGEPATRYSDGAFAALLA